MWVFCTSNERSWNTDMFSLQDFENSDQNWGSYGLEKDLWLVTSMRGSGYFDCQSHNSLNFGPIFKILVAKHISGPRPFIWCAEHPRGTWPRASKRVLKLVHENQKSCFFDENQLLGHIPQTFFNGSPQRCTQSLSFKFGVIRTKTKKVMRVKSWNL